MRRVCSEMSGGEVWEICAHFVSFTLFIASATEALFSPASVRPSLGLFVREQDHAKKLPKKSIKFYTMVGHNPGIKQHDFG